MFQKKEYESNYDIVIGEKSIIKGDLDSEGSIRVDGKIIGNITTLGNVIVSENAYVNGNITCSNAEIFGVCEGDVKVKGKLNLHQKSTLIGEVLAKSFNTKEGASFKGNCTVDPEEDMQITVDSSIHDPNTKTLSKNLVDFTKSTPRNNKSKKEDTPEETKNAQ
ncbi:bactofilin family protein [Fusibacter tunisiensis]|uniref:Cytoskeletal protein CcmA (Bactofilin family) n=1 Tax=Fusibacter tunisiensis TaxID=1008308 RepID=A0ABS2MSQ0_9FIRM|nr:polymer-forming cytoskeletal protein [Fusibacter tunisiensis]MBM7562392.1 cytoskeletal protein CcmA (bactofilin family) [Fusibacter tunisiensis]